MRYRKGHKDETRRRIVEVASRRFRRDGIAATGIAGLMADAGLTHGGFYAHFPSKDELVCCAAVCALDAAKARLELAAAKARSDGRDGLAAIVESYLDPHHRDEAEDGCACAALAPELARVEPAARAGVADALSGLLEVIAAEIAPAPGGRERAGAVFAIMLGTLQLARLVEGRQAEELLAGGRAAALALAGRPLAGRSSAGPGRVD